MGERARLLFSEGHLMAIVSGQKRLTLRLFRKEAHSFKKNQIVYGDFPEGISLMLEITEDTAFTDARDIPDDVAQEDGYSGGENAFQSLRKYYPTLVGGSTIAIIRFKIAEIYDEPVIKLTN